MSWQVLSANSEILAIHAAYLGATNEIIYFGGDEHIPEHSAKHQVDATRLFSVATQTVTKISSPIGDVFCCGHAFLGDGQVLSEGRLLVGGGTDAFPKVPEGLPVINLHDHHFHGIRECSIYRPKKKNWSKAALFNPGVATDDCEKGKPSGGRWYPTLLTLSDGSVLAMSGHPGDCDFYHDNFIPEVFTTSPAPNGAWHRLGSFTDPAQRQLFESHNVTYFPRLHLLPTGDIISASPIAGRTCSLSIGHSPWSGTFHDIASFDDVTRADPFKLYDHFGASSVLLPLLPEDNYTARVLIAGAEQPFILDLNGWNPAQSAAPGQFRWHPTAPRQLAGSPRRVNGHLVLLPTGEVCACGGVEGVPTPGVPPPDGLQTPDQPAVLKPEIFNPFTQAWSVPNDPAQVVRNYHSVALLLADGSVWTAGSDHNAAQGQQARELRFEIYRPWYDGNPDRPHIDAAPERVYSHEQWPLKTTQASRIRRVAMVRCGSCTHAFNPDQRYIGLRFKHSGPDELIAEFPPNNNIMVPGFYFLYVINDAGLPSYGTTVYARPDKR